LLDNGLQLWYSICMAALYKYDIGKVSKCLIRCKGPSNKYIVQLLSFTNWQEETVNWNNHVMCIDFVTLYIDALKCHKSYDICVA
jgi:hypothetical protein